MAETIVLEATKRQVTGKQVRHLRAEGVIPGVLYGPELESIPLQMNWLELRPTLRQAGGTHVIELNVDGEKYNALVREVQRSPLRGDVLHVDFYRVRMDVAIRTEIPIVLEGEARAIDEAGGIVNLEMTSIEVECLPGDLPSSIELDITGLKEVGDLMTVADLPEIAGVTYMADPEAIVIATTYLRAAEPEEEGEEEGESAEPELIRRREEGFDDEV